MATIHFLGYLRHNFLLSAFSGQFPEVRLTTPDCIEVGIVVQIEDSRLFVKCDVGDHAVDGSWLHRQADRVVHCIADSLTFRIGMAIVPILEKITRTDGVTERIIFRDSNLPGICSSYDPEDPQSLLDMYILLLHNPGLAIAMNDLTASAAGINLVFVNCARAVDTIRNLISPNTDAIDGWKNMQQQLNISRDYLTFVTGLSKGHRHGDYGALDDDKTEDARQRAWIIMDRFLHFLKGGSVPLDRSLFPELQ